MQITKTHKIIISIIAVAILFAGYVYINKKSKTAKNEGTLGDNSLQVATGTNSGIKAGTFANGANYTIEPIPSDKEKSVPQPIPDLNRLVTKSSMADVSENDTLTATRKIKELQSLLKNNPSSFPNWLDLASYQKLAGDYDGAIISWKYAGRLIPTDFISVANIGNLYAYYLKNNAQAEIYYKLAISKGPTQSYLYTQLAEIYRDIFKDMDKARAIVDQGLSKIPNDPNLLELKNSLN